MAPQPDEDTPMMAFIGAVVKYGWPALAAFLIWQLSATVSRDASDTKAMLGAHMELSSQRASRIQESLDRTERLNGTIIDLLRQSCVNASHTYGERQACFMAGSSR